MSEPFVYRRTPDGTLEPTRSSYQYPERQLCTSHGPYDAGIDGCCIHCYQKIAPRTIIIIEDPVNKE